MKSNEKLSFEKLAKLERGLSSWQGRADGIQPLRTRRFRFTKAVGVIFGKETQKELSNSILKLYLNKFQNFGMHYVVQGGDSYSKIAAKIPGVSAKELKKWNDNRNLQAQAVIRIAPKSKILAEIEKRGLNVVTISSNGLSAIASGNRMTLGQLLNLNPKFKKRPSETDAQWRKRLKDIPKGTKIRIHPAPSTLKSSQDGFSADANQAQADDRRDPSIDGPKGALESEEGPNPDKRLQIVQSNGPDRLDEGATPESGEVDDKTGRAEKDGNVENTPSTQIASPQNDGEQGPENTTIQQQPASNPPLQQAGLQSPSLNPLEFNTRVPAFSPLKQDQPFKTMTPEQAKEARIDQKLDQNFMKNFLKGDKICVEEMKRLRDIALKDGGSLAVDPLEKPQPFADMTPEKARRGIALAKRDAFFTSRYLEGDADAYNRMGRLFATAFAGSKTDNKEDSGKRGIDFTKTVRRKNPFGRSIESNDDEDRNGGGFGFS